MTQETLDEKDCIIINGEKFKREEVNFSKVVIDEFREKPFVNYKYFVNKYGIPKQKVFTIFHIARKKGIELRPNRKPWTRKNRENLSKKGKGGSDKKA